MKKQTIVVLLSAFFLLTTGCARNETKEDTVEDLTVEQIYLLANTALRDGNYTQAIDFYQKLEARYPYGKYAEQAQIDSTYAYFKNNDPELAVAAADRFIRLHPTHPSVDYAYYIKGLSSYREDASFYGRVAGNDDLSDRDAQAARSAFNTFRELLTKFPSSQYADDSRQRIAYLLNALARHEVAVADYYLRLGAYVAVVNRAKFVVENYQTAPAVENALALMMDAYREMGMNGLAQDTRRVLETNFPQSEFLIVADG